MGKYSNVNANSLKSAANTALNELSNYSNSSTHQNLNNFRNLSTAAKDTLINALSSVISKKDVNGSIPRLVDALNNLKSAADYISKCQELEREICELEDEKYSYDLEGNRTINYWVVRAINNKQISLNNYELKVDNLLS